MCVRITHHVMPVVCTTRTHSIADLNAGVTLLLDARSSRTHGPMKHLLEKIVVSWSALCAYMHVPGVSAILSTHGCNYDLTLLHLSISICHCYIIIYRITSLTENIMITTSLVREVIVLIIIDDDSLS